MSTSSWGDSGTRAQCRPNHNSTAHPHTVSLLLSVSLPLGQEQVVGFEADKAKLSPHFKVTSLSSAVVSDPTHCFRSQKTHQSVFWSSVAKVAMQPKASLPEFLIHGPRVHLYGFYVHQCGWTQVLVLCFYFIIPQMII